MKQTLTKSLLLLFVLISTGFCSIAQTYTLSDDDVVVVDGVIQSCQYNFALKKIIIPETLDDQTVTGIADGDSEDDGVFYNKGIEELTLPSTIEYIGGYAFSNNALTELDLTTCPNLKEIGAYTFYSNLLENVDFTGCSKLMYISGYSFQSNKITDLSFTGCSSLRKIFVKAFSYNELRSVDFSNCSSLLFLYNNVFEFNKIENVNFDGCTSLLRISNKVFYENLLTSIDLTPCTALIYIGTEAFNYNSIGSFTLPVNASSSFINWKDADGKTYQGGEATSDKTSSYVADMAYTLTDDDVVVVDGVIQSYSHDTIVTKIIIPEILDDQVIIGIAGAENYVEGMFYDKELFDIEFPSTIEFIGDFAFGKNDFSHLDLTSCPKLISIGQEAFRTNYSLTSLDMSNCTELKTIALGAFYDCYLNSLDFSNNAKLDSIGLLAFDENVVENVVLPKNSALRSIGGKAFYNNELKSFDLTRCPKLEYIGYGAFANNYITELNFSKCTVLSTIEGYAFAYCDITSVDLTDCIELTYIGEYAFEGNVLERYTLPECGIENFIEWKADNGTAYDNGAKVTDLSLRLTADIQDPYTLTDSDVVVEDGVIVSCSYDFEIKNIIIPTKLDDQDVIAIADGLSGEGVFSNKGIVILELPVSIESIGNNAFSSNSLKTVNISDCLDLKYIGNSSFQENDLLEIEIYDCNGLTYIGTDAFEGNIAENFRLPNSTAEHFVEWQDEDKNAYESGKEVYSLSTSYSVYQKITNNITETACKEYDFNGEILTESGEYSKTLITDKGIDSIINLTLTINPVYNLTAEKTVEFGETYEFGSQTLTESGEYTETFSSINSCDSIITITFIVLPDPNQLDFDELTELNISLMDKYTGGDYHVSDLQKETSVVINDAKEGNTTQEVIDAQVQKVKNALDPSKAIVENISETACEEFDFEGEKLTESGEYSKTYTAESGADSTINLSLIINSAYNLTDEKTVAFGESYTFGTQTLTKSGEYTETFTSVNGCDSTVTLTFTVLTEVLEKYSISFDIDNVAGDAVSNVSIEINNKTYNVDELSTIAGELEINDIEPGNYPFIIRSEGYSDFEGTVTVTDSDIIIPAISLVKETVTKNTPKAGEITCIVFPQPADEFISIEAEGVFTVFIYSADGQLVLSEGLIDKTHIEINHLPAGLYTLKLTGAKASYSQVIVKK